MGHRQRYVPGRQGFLLALSNSAALWHMSGAPWISVEWVYTQTGVVLGKTFPVAYLYLYLFIYICTGASLMAQMVKNPSAMEETWVWSLGWEDSPGGGHGNPLQYSCLENSHGRRSLMGYSPWGHKESDTNEHNPACLHWVLIAAWAFSSCGSRGCSLLQRTGFSLRWLLLLWLLGCRAQASVVAAPGLVAPQRVGSS